MDSYETKDVLIQIKIDITNIKQDLIDIKTILFKNNTEENIEHKSIHSDKTHTDIEDNIIQPNIESESDDSKVVSSDEYISENIINNILHSDDILDEEFIEYSNVKDYCLDTKKEKIINFLKSKNDNLDLLNIDKIISQLDNFLL